jgi:hypothetical protein
MFPLTQTSWTKQLTMLRCTVTMSRCSFPDTFHMAGLYSIGTPLTIPAVIEAFRRGHHSVDVMCITRVLGFARTFLIYSNLRVLQ